MKTSLNLPEHSATTLRDRLATGRLTATELVSACIARIEARDADIGAWAWFDPEAAIGEAGRLDAFRDAGGRPGPLHGLPVGIKDIIDTAGIPTENGCTIDAGRVPERDAAVVKKLRAAGAVVIGKTVTTELAYLHPGKTRNPRNLAHTPGGSSSGSAAAVADGMVPLAIGTQTGGSVIRPASFCGITGFKPTFGAIPRDGVLMQSHSLDTVGVFAWEPAGVALLADILFEADGAASGAEGGLFNAVQEACESDPAFAVVYPPGSENADPSMKAAFGAFCEGLGHLATRAALPGIFDDAAALRARINHAEMTYHFRGYVENSDEHLGRETRSAIKDGGNIAAFDYLAALECQRELPAALEPLFSRFDVLLCPASLGPAPEGLGSTGDAIMNGLWTMAGTPALTLPLLTSSNGLPMGVQLVGRPGDDGRVLQIASWLWERYRAGRYS